MWVLLILASLLVAAGAVGFWLRRSQLLPTYLTDDDPRHIPLKALAFAGFVFLPFISIPLLIIYLVREARRTQP